MELDLSSLLAGFVYGVFGVYLIRQGRKTANLAYVGIGIALLAYPYFVSGFWLNWLPGAALLALAYQLRRRSPFG